MCVCVGEDLYVEKRNDDVWMMRDTRKGDIDGCVCVVAMSFEAYCIVRDSKLEKI